jgi:Flp pilus assembly protein protease CpaA
MGTSSVVQSGSAKRGQWRLKVTFWLDVTLLVSVAALQTVSFTGLVIHEWLGLAIVVMVLAHLLFAWSWIASQSSRLLAVQTLRSRVNYLLNLTLFAGVTAVIFSGILISQKAIPTLTGTKAAPDMDWRWDTLHNQFSQAVLMLSGFHLAINWDWAHASVQKVLFPWVEKVQERFRRFREGAL